MKSLSLLKSGKFINQLASRNFSVSSYQSNKKVAVVLSGCGVYDGTEIVEATSFMIHLSRHNAEISFFAPNIELMHVINHSNGEVQPEVRNVLVESARICRGDIKPLEKLKSSEFQALFIPGGFGAAKNLSDYAVNNYNLKVNKDLERVLQEFLAGFKPIGLCCIAPVIIAKVMPGCELTVGKTGKDWPYGGTVESLKIMGANVFEKDVNEIHVDHEHKIVTTPAYMKNATYFEIFSGIGLMVDEVLKFIK